MILTIKVSGKFFDEDLERGEPRNLSLLSNEILNLVSEGHRIAVVTGGGATARKYIALARKIYPNESMLDVLGIASSRLNAHLLLLSLRDFAYSRIPESLERLVEFWGLGKVIVAGGFQPGQSTTAVAALVAEATNSQFLVNCTNIDGVFERDPRDDPSARLLERIKVGELRKILSSSRSAAGTYELADTLALNVLERSGISMIVMNFSKVSALRQLLKGETRFGTIVEPK